MSTDAAGWYLCYSDDAKRVTWHYFESRASRSLCGSGSSYQRSIGAVEYAAQMSWFPLLKGGACGRCTRVRRPIEDPVSPQRKDLEAL